MLADMRATRKKSPGRPSYDTSTGEGQKRLMAESVGDTYRPTLTRAEFRTGDRVEYRDVNLTQQGTVTGSDGKWTTVRWDGYSFESREWSPNLRHVSTGTAHATRSSASRHHATKKTPPAQLQREIDEELARGSSQRERDEMEMMLTRAGFDPGHARQLQNEGMGPYELSSRLAIPSGVGSLQYSHGFSKRPHVAKTAHQRSKLSHATKQQKSGPQTELTYRGWRITPFEGTQMGYKLPESRKLRARLGFDTRRKFKGYEVHYPETEHGGGVKIVKTIKEARENIDDYLGPEAS